MCPFFLILLPYRTCTTPKRQYVQFFDIFHSFPLFHARHVAQIAFPSPTFHGVVSDFDSRADGVSASVCWEDLGCDVSLCN
jgi:hypothetical protein